MGDVGAWALWRAEKGEEFSVEPALTGSAGHFHREDRSPQRAGYGAKARRVLVPEALHDRVLPMPLSP
ncbi:hypothetical protein MPLA_670089 [Mesorhizobium sp. ORS 3359]|nr:hypothetical protein MPLA_670089 [Mesorhizobium sp. ORS 3359]